MKKQFILTILGVFAIILLFANTNVQANYQMKPNSTSVLVSLNDFMNNVRNMEADGQVMGLSETHDSTTLKPTTTENGIDVHMQKNTEYGACILLSASPKYGKQGTGSDSYIQSSTSTGIATTTGNQYGVYNIGNSWEWTAGGGATSYYNNGYKAIPYNARYYNIYNPLTSKRGDATTETSNWKGSGYSSFVSRDRAFVRSSSGVFSFDYRDSNYKSYGRAAVVCGVGHRTLMWFCPLLLEAVKNKILEDA